MRNVGVERVTLALVLAALPACARSAAVVAPAPLAATSPDAHAPAREAGATADEPSGIDKIHKGPDGESYVWVEWVDADVLRVKTLRAISIEANEIRCPHVLRGTSAPVPKEMGWRRVEGDVVDVDNVLAHHVRARLVIADEIDAVVVKRVTKPYRWAGAGAGPPVRNRVVYVDPETGVASPQRSSAGLATPVF